MMTKSLDPMTCRGGGESWDVKRERLDAGWLPILDEKGRQVHGYAIIYETPVHMLGRTIVDGLSSLSISDKPFGVAIIATRDGKTFGAIPRTTRYTTREAAHTQAQKALAKQGKRYAKKFGGAS